MAVDGSLAGTWEPPAAKEPSTAFLFWSTDDIMATVAGEPWDLVIHFVDMTGTDRNLPDDLPYGRMVGWRSPTSIVVHSDLGGGTLSELSILDGSRRVLSRFSTAGLCEYGMSSCRVFRLQLAANLLPGADLRPSDPDRGAWAPVWPWWLPLPIVLVVAVLVLLASPVVHLFVRRRRRRRSRRSGPGDAE